MLDCFSCIQLFVILRMVAHQTPLSLGFPWLEYWSRLPCSPLGDLPDLGIKPASPIFLHWQASSLPLTPPGKPILYRWVYVNIPLEKGMTIHSSSLSWRIPWTEEAGRLQSMGWQRVDMTEHRLTLSLFRGKYICLREIWFPFHGHLFQSFFSNILPVEDSFWLRMFL